MGFMKAGDKVRKPLFDEYDGFSFMKGWPQIARWASVLPAVLVAFFVARILIIGTVAMLLERVLPELVSAYLNALLVFLIYYVTLFAAGAAAPLNGRTPVVVVLAVLVSFGLITASWNVWSEVEGHDSTLLLISTLMSVWGAVTAAIHFVRLQKASLQAINPVGK